MISRIGRLVRAEFIKISASPFLYVALAVIVAASILSEWLQPIINDQKETPWRHLHAIQLFAYGFSVGRPLATFVLLIFSSMMFAGEFDRGTIKNLLTRPLSRTDFFAAKAITVIALAAALYAFTLYASLPYALVRGEMGAVWDDRIYDLRRSYAEILGHAGKAVVMCFPGFLAAGFLGLLVSNWTEASGYAVAIALVLYLFGDLVSGLLPHGTQTASFFYYGSYALGKLREFAGAFNTRWDEDLDARLLWLWVPLAYLSGFWPPAYVIFRLRNITA
jgi:hypothetical protein